MSRFGASLGNNFSARAILATKTGQAGHQGYAGQSKALACWGKPRVISQNFDQNQFLRVGL